MERLGASLALEKHLPTAHVLRSPSQSTMQTYRAMRWTVQPC